MKDKNLIQNALKLGWQRMDSYIRSHLSHSIVKEACKWVEAQATFVIDSLLGGEIKRLELTLEAKQESSLESKSDLSKLKAQRDNTQKLVKVAPSKAKLNKDESQKMQMMEIVSFYVLILFLIVLLFTAGSNVYSSLMGSGNPVFIEHPELAILISFLFPCSVFSVKFFKSCFLQAKSKRAFDKVVYSLSTFAIFNWIFWLSIVYGSGASTGIDLENLDGNTGYESVLMFSQLVCELLVSTSLFLAASHIYERHSPGTYFINHERLDVDKEFELKTQTNGTLSEEVFAIEEQLTELKNIRQAFINDQVAKFLSLRGRLDSGSHKL